MKKLCLMCLVFCLLGCQVNEKEKPDEVKQEEVIENKTIYQFEVEPFDLSAEFYEIKASYPDSHLYFYQANENKLLFGFSDPTCMDQVGATKALYVYDLISEEIKELKPTSNYYHVQDAMVYQNHYLYMIKNKDEGTYQIIMEDETGQQTILENTLQVGFMQLLKFTLGNNEVYYTYKTSDERKETILYNKISQDLKLQKLWEKTFDNNEMPNLVLYQDKALLSSKVDDQYRYVYLDKDNEIKIDYQNMSNPVLLEDYIIFDEKNYYDINGKEVKETTTSLPIYINQRYKYHNVLIGLNENTNSLYIKQLDNKEVTTGDVYSFTNKIYYLEYRDIDEKHILMMHLGGIKGSNDCEFYKINISQK